MIFSGFHYCTSFVTFMLYIESCGYTEAVSSKDKLFQCSTTAGHKFDKFF